MKRNTVLIVDDELVVRDAISDTLKYAYDLVTAHDFGSGLAAYEKHSIDLAILDINYGRGETGIDLLREIKKRNRLMPVIICSVYAEIEKVVECIQLGATDYIAKNSHRFCEELLIRVGNNLTRDKETRALAGFVQETQEKNEIVTVNPEMLQILEEIKIMGPANLLIEGETGVGKTPLAQFANRNLAEGGSRPFVRVNCAGLSPERLQDELFGHKRGAYTGAAQDKQGLVELAKDGDLFLDEIGDLPLDCQSELLMFLDSGEYRRLGDPKILFSNCRIIAATNLRLKDRVLTGHFRKDLYSRLAACKIWVPPLRERDEDIEPLTRYFVKRLCGIAKPLDSKVLACLQKHDWKEGNVRELKDTVWYLCQKGKPAATLQLEMLPPRFRFRGASSSSSIDAEIIWDYLVDKENVYKRGFENYLDDIEKIVLAKLVHDEASTKTLAEKMGVSEATCFRKLRKYNLFIENNRYTNKVNSNTRLAEIAR